VVDAPPRTLADRLADPDAPAAWFPIRVEPSGRTPRRWRAGSRFDVLVGIAGEQVRMAVTVARVGADGVRFMAAGPVELDGNLRFERDGGAASRVRARVHVGGRGLGGDALAGATVALLRGGALEHALQVVKQRVEHPGR
jgi:hypothetical protein